VRSAFGGPYSPLSLASLLRVSCRQKLRDFHQFSAQALIRDAEVSASRFGDGVRPVIPLCFSRRPGPGARSQGLSGAGSKASPTLTTGAPVPLAARGGRQSFPPFPPRSALAHGSYRAAFNRLQRDIGGQVARGRRAEAARTQGSDRQVIGNAGTPVHSSFLIFRKNSWPQFTFVLDLRDRTNIVVAVPLR